MNRTLKLLIMSDALVFTGFGLITPILAVYINTSITGGTIAAIGLMSTIFLITKTIFQLLFAKIFQPKHRFYMVWLGTFLIACVPIIYLLASHMWHFYLAQFIYGVGGGLAYPAWFSLFASNLSKGKQGFEWSIYSGSVGVGAGIAAFVGSNLASSLGFPLTFLIAGIISLIGMIILLGLEKDNLKEILPSEMFVTKHKPGH
jgi:MFS transporter, OPA family, sugar phosphate sensor protein UhpC